MSHFKKCSRFVQGNTNATSKIILAHCAKRENSLLLFHVNFSLMYPHLMNKIFIHQNELIKYKKGCTFLEQL